MKIKIFTNTNSTLLKNFSSCMSVSVGLNLGNYSVKDDLKQHERYLASNIAIRLEIWKMITFHDGKEIFRNLSIY